MARFAAVKGGGKAERQAKKAERQTKRIIGKRKLCKLPFKKTKKGCRLPKGLPPTPKGKPPTKDKDGVIVPRFEVASIGRGSKKSPKRLKRIKKRLEKKLYR